MDEKRVSRVRESIWSTVVADRIPVRRVKGVDGLLHLLLETEVLPFVREWWVATEPAKIGENEALFDLFCLGFFYRDYGVLTKCIESLPRTKGQRPCYTQQHHPRAGHQGLNEER